jgi:mRNA (guanine-N7-)-methyltransferase
MEWRKPFAEVWQEEKNDSNFSQLSERMGVKDRYTGKLLVNDEEMNAASFYHAFSFYKV